MDELNEAMLRITMVKADDVTKEHPLDEDPSEENFEPMSDDEIDEVMSDIDSGAVDPDGDGDDDSMPHGEPEEHELDEDPREVEFEPMSEEEIEEVLDELCGEGSEEESKESENDNDD
jgi:hypothetical protein